MKDSWGTVRTMLAIIWGTEIYSNQMFDTGPLRRRIVYIIRRNKLADGEQNVPKG